MMINDKLSSVIKKIEQLRAIAKSTSSVNEAATAMAMAQRLLTQYQLDEATVSAETNKIEDPIDLEKEVMIYESKKVTPWKKYLAFNFPELVGCFVFCSLVRGGGTHRTESRYRIIGKTSAVQLCQYMFDLVVAEIERLAEANVPSRGIRGRNPAKESFCLGAAHGIIKKMKTDREMTMSTANVAAMVLVSQQAKDAERAFVAKTKTNFTYDTKQSKAQLNRAQYGSGFEKGQSISINAGLNTGAAREPNRLY